MKPNFRLIANNSDITDLIRENFMSLSVTDSSGVKSDTLKIELNDKNRNIQWPKKNARLQLYLGYNDNLFNKGSFIVDEPEYTFPANKLTINARGAHVANMGSQKKTRDWANISLGNIIKTIASEHKLAPAVADDIANLQFDDFHQVDESDFNFLNRIATLTETICQVKSGYLVLKPKRSQSSVSGLQMPVISVYEKDCSGYTYIEKASDEYTGVKAFWNEKVVIDYTRWGWGKFTFYRKHSLIVGSSKKLREISNPFATEEEARTAAESMLAKIGTSASTLSITFDHGQPQLSAETVIVPENFIEPVRGADWVADSVSHTLNSSGLKTSMSLLRSIEYTRKQKDKNKTVSKPKPKRRGLFF